MGLPFPPGGIVPYCYTYPSAFENELTLYPLPPASAIIRFFFHQNDIPMQAQPIPVYNSNIEESFLNLLKHYGVPEEEISLPMLKNMRGQLLKNLWETYHKMSEKVNELYPLVVQRSKGGIIFQLQGDREGRILFHGAQDKALYLFFRKHGAENLSSQGFLWAKEKDKRIRQSLLGIYRATRGNRQDTEYLALIEKLMRKV